MNFSAEDFRKARTSCAIWSAYWVMTFIASGFVTILLIYGYDAYVIGHRYNVDLNLVVSVTVLGLTISVISGHVPKLVSYASGYDTDFKAVENKDKTKRYKAKSRLAATLFLFALALFLIFVMHYLTLDNDSEQDYNNAVYPFGGAQEIIKFFQVTVKYFPTILCLIVAQLIFSWPDAGVKKKTINFEPSGQLTGKEEES